MLSLPCVLAIAVISIFGADNTRIVQGLEPAASLKPAIPQNDPRLFNLVTIGMDAFSPASSVNCSDIARVDMLSSSAVACEVSRKEDQWNGATFCRVRFKCTVGSNCEAIETAASRLRTIPDDCGTCCRRRGTDKTLSPT